MATNKLFIPDKINCGFQKRDGTYTGKLAYVIYYDQKGVLRKETSWNTWRDKKIPNIEFDNKPIDGFVLNKGVGGQRQSYGWNARNEYIRVYDPRDFEFEISVANLLFILRECDCSKGKGLEGKFVYAWDGTELVLLPVISTDYVESTGFTELQSKSVKAKDLVAGCTYVTKKQVDLVYLGKLDWYPNGDSNKKEDKQKPMKKHIFIDTSMDKKKSYSWYSRIIPMTDLKNIASISNDQQHEEFAELMAEYYSSRHGSKIKELFPVEKDTYYGDAYYSINGKSCCLFKEYQPNYWDRSKIIPRHGYYLTVTDGVVTRQSIERNNLPVHNDRYRVAFRTEGGYEYGFYCSRFFTEDKN